MKSRLPFLAVVSGLLMGSLSPQSMAVTFSQHPSRSVQMIRRLSIQNRRIQQYAREGKPDPWQTQRIHRINHGIREEERRFTRVHGEAIPRAEQARIDRQERRVDYPREQ